MPDNSPVRFGILGAGRISRNAFAPSLESSDCAILHAVASRDIERAKSMNPVRAYDNYDELINDPEVEAVYIGTHNGLHHQQTIACLEAGKHVLCEKPLGCTPDECREMLDVANRTGKYMVEAFMYRYHPQIRKTLDLIAEGLIGDVRSIEATFTGDISDPNDPRMNPEWGGGSIFDVGCYCVNFCRLIFDAMPENVVATGTFHPEFDVDFNIHGVLDFGQGRSATIISAFDRAFCNRATIIGTKGWIELPRPFTSSGQETWIITGEGYNREKIHFDSCDTYALELADLANAIRIGTAPMLLPDEGLKNALVIDSLLTSTQNHSQPVSLSSLWPNLHNLD